MTDKHFAPEGALIGTPGNSARLSSLRALEAAMLTGATVEGIAVLCDAADMSLRVDLGSAVGIIPREEAIWPAPGTPVKDIAILTRVGKPVACKILSIDASGDTPRVQLSRRAAQRECAETYLAALRPGDVIPARVTHLEPFGAFVDIGCGIVSLLTVDAISVSRISHPRDRLAVGQRIHAVVRSIEPDTGRLYMSLRELLGTWEENAAFFHAGETVTGVVRSVEPYGIFVELAPNLAGLAELKPDVSAGTGCSVYIKSIIPERMKIKLVLIDTHPEVPPAGIRYFVDPNETKHIAVWRYSPPCCAKITETVFDA